MTTFNLAGNMAWQRDHYSATFGGIPVSKGLPLQEFDPYAFESETEAQKAREAWRQADEWTRAEYTAHRETVKIAIITARMKNDSKNAVFFTEILRTGRYKSRDFRWIAANYVGMTSDQFRQLKRNYHNKAITE